MNSFQTVEAKKIISLTNPNDLEIFVNSDVKILPSAQELLSATVAKRGIHDQLARANDLGLVIGSSGSGKTFFPLGELAGNVLFRDEKQHLHGGKKWPFSFLSKGH